MSFSRDRRWDTDPPIPFRAIGGGLVLLLLVACAWSTYYTVPAESEAVVLRFGRYSRTVQPGLRFKLPFGIEQAFRVPVRRQLKVEFGFGTTGASRPEQFAPLDRQADERGMVTGDLNSVLVEWVVQYRITDPRAYLFHVRDPAGTLRDISEAVMRQVIGDRTVDEVITIGRQDIETEALKNLDGLVKLYGMGLTIDQVQLKNVNPPEAVQASFNEVNQAQQERERAINVARGEVNKTIPRARGLADQLIREAEGYATQRVNEAKGDATKFTALLTEYLKAPEVTRRRIYLETMQEVLPRLGRRIIVDADARQVLPILSLGPETLLAPPVATTNRLGIRR